MLTTDSITKNRSSADLFEDQVIIKWNNHSSGSTSYGTLLLSSILCRVPLHTYLYNLTSVSISNEDCVSSGDDSHEQEAAISCGGGIECVVFTCSMFSPISSSLSFSRPLYYVTPRPHPCSYQ